MTKLYKNVNSTYYLSLFITIWLWMLMFVYGGGLRFSSLKGVHVTSWVIWYLLIFFWQSFLSGAISSNCFIIFLFSFYNSISTLCFCLTLTLFNVSMCSKCHLCWFIIFLILYYSLGIFLFSILQFIDHLTYCS